MGCMPSRSERVLHEGDDDPVHRVRKGIKMNAVKLSY